MTPDQAYEAWFMKAELRTEHSGRYEHYSAAAIYEAWNAGRAFERKRRGGVKRTAHKAGKNP